MTALCVCGCLVSIHRLGAEHFHLTKLEFRRLMSIILRKKEIKSQLAPWSAPSADVFSDSGHLHLNAHWPQQFLVVMQLCEAIPRIALPADEVALQAVMQTAWAWDAFCLSIPPGMLLSLPCPSPESPKHLAFPAALFKNPQHFP